MSITTPDSITVISDASDPALMSDGTFTVTDPQTGKVTVYSTNKNLYLTTVTETTEQKFITNQIQVASGSNGQIQYVQNGNLAGSPYLTFNPNTAQLSTSALLVSNEATLGLLQNIKIYGGSNGQIIATDGTGNLNWVTDSSTGTGTVTSVGISSNTLAVTNTPITTAGNINLEIPANVPPLNSIRSNNFTQGNSTVTVSNQTWAVASTFNSIPNQIIFSMPATNIASIDFHITATDDNVARQVAKIIAVNLGAVTEYTEYGTLVVGPRVADYDVQRVADNINLTVSPTTANTVQYKIVITAYEI